MDYKLHYSGPQDSDNQLTTSFIVGDPFHHSDENEAARPQSNTEMFRSYHDEIEKVNEELYKI